MQCYVYKSLSKQDVYVYLDRRDDFTQLPPALHDLLGELRFVLVFELTPQRRLAKETAGSVLHNLNARGYHLQMPDTRAARERAH